MVVLIVLVGVVFFAVGRWGNGRVPELVSERLEPKARQKTERVLRRGVVVVQIVGLLLVGLSLLIMVHPPVQR